MALYDRIGRGYGDTRRADPRIALRLASHLALTPHGRYLDLACGTGSYTEVLERGGGRWSGLDPSALMLAEARARSSTIDWSLGGAEALPYEDASFDAVVCTLGVHHFDDPLAAFREVRRVLRDGPFVIFACDYERTRRFWLRDYFPQMFERMAERELSERKMVADLEAAGFRRVVAEPFDVPEDLQDHFLYSGKHRPELYFDPAIRAGISAFANPADPDEVVTGLARLRADLSAGRVPKPAGNGSAPAGDYVFLIARS